jgi:hypothetical protein
MFLRKLLANDCTYVGLFLDNKNLRDIFIQSNNILELGISYAVKGIELNGAFHPKVYLMLGENKAKVIVGSGNLTASGVIINIEAFNVFRFDNNDESNKRNFKRIKAEIINNMHQLDLMFNKDGLIRKRDLGIVEQLVHYLKTSAEKLGNTRLKNIAFKLELATRAFDYTEVVILYVKLKEIFTETIFNKE